MNLARGVVMILALAFLAGCGGGGKSVSDQNAARESVLQADRDFNDATAREGIDGWVRHFAPEGRQVAPGQQVIGHAAIREYMGPLFADPDRRLTWAPDHAEVSADGTMGYTTGTYRSTLRDSTGLEEVRGTGRYVSIWKKDADGNWKVVCDLGNPDAPPPAPEPPASE